MSKENHTLLSWLQHIKHHHDKRQSITIVTPDKQKYVVNHPVLTHREDEPIVVANVEPPVAARASADMNNGDDKSSSKSKPASIFSAGARRFKNNLIHFHRPHGLLFQNHSTADNKTDSIKQRENRENSADSNNNPRENGCYCCNTNTATSNIDADDELEEQQQQQDDSSSVRSKDWTKHPPCLCNTHINMTAVDDNASNYSNSNDDISRENSIFSLPDDIDSPDVGFKKLRKDGDLVDWDELSTFMDESDDDDEYDNQTLEHAKSRLFTRSVVRNDLIRLALNG